jgi:DNA-binding response OmpR family regulator
VARHCCLILEDQALIGLALEASLDEAGFEVAGPFEKSSQALDWLSDQTPDLAVIDVLLKDGPCLPVARELRRRKVPFAIYSGLKPPLPAASEFQDVPWLQKPVSREQLRITLQRLARQVSIIAFEPAEDETKDQRARLTPAAQP